MARSAEAYRDALLASLPRGSLWPRDPDTTLADFLLSWGDALARLDTRIDDLLEEADPRGANETIADWEADFGLPDPCSGPALLLAARRAQLVARITTRGGQSVAYFVALAAALGFVVSIEEPEPWTCISRCIDPLYDHSWDWYWIVHGPAVTVIPWTCLDPCTAPLATWGNTPLECAVRRYAPADTSVLFRYGD